MATRIQFRRGTTAQHASFTGAVGEMTVDTDKEVVVVHDGSTAGGFEMARADVNNVTNPQFGGTGSLRVPVGTSAQRTASPVNGMLRYNTTTGGYEGYSGSTWSALGKVVQVQQGLLTATRGQFSGFWHSISGLSATITPQSTSNKVLILVNITVGVNATTSAFKVLRNGSEITARGDASGSRSRAWGGGANTNYSWRHAQVGAYMDSPSSTSALTYQVYVGSHASGNTFYVNRSGNNSNDANLDNAQHASSIVLLEIAG